MVKIDEQSRIVINLIPIILKFTPIHPGLIPANTHPSLVWFNEFIRRLGIETIIKIIFIQHFDMIDNKVLLYQYLEATDFCDDYAKMIEDGDLIIRFEILIDSIIEECDNYIRAKILESPLPYPYSRYSIESFICQGVAVFGVYEVINGLDFDNNPAFL